MLIQDYLKVKRPVELILQALHILVLQFYQSFVKHGFFV